MPISMSAKAGGSSRCHSGVWKISSMTAWNAPEEKKRPGFIHITHAGLDRSCSKEPRRAEVSVACDLFSIPQSELGEIDFLSVFHQIIRLSWLRDCYRRSSGGFP